MGENADFVWNNGERNRQLDVYRPCPCGTCSRTCKGIGYLSFSDSAGRGFTIWIENEEVFQRLTSALRHFGKRSGRKMSRGSRDGLGRLAGPNTRTNAKVQVINRQRRK
jgi:hypothetical protein